MSKQQGMDNVDSTSSAMSQAVDDGAQSQATMINKTINTSERRRREDELVTLNLGTEVAGRWSIAKKLGSGAFGAVYLAHGTKTSKHAGASGALKTEGVSTEQCLWQEALIMRTLAVMDTGAEHFCRCLDEGKDVQQDAKSGKRVELNFIVMSLVGKPLYKLMDKNGGSFSPGTTIGVSLQLLKALKALHHIGYLHLDIKPENAAIGREDRQQIFLIDFGLTRRFISSGGLLRRRRSKTHFRGTPMYASIAAHQRRDYCRRDDLESWFYMMVEMFTGSLPWSKQRKEHKTGEMKSERHKPDPQVRQRALNELLQGCPPQFGLILQYIDSVKFYQKPNYDWIEAVLRGYLAENNIEEHPYDWCK